jgi:hypothetical protein
MIMGMVGFLVFNGLIDYKQGTVAGLIINSHLIRNSGE